MSIERLMRAAVFGLAAAGAGVAAPQPTFRSGVDLVTVDAAVHDADGRPVATLRAEDFRLEVDGRRRAITSAQFVALGVQPTAINPGAAHFSTNEGVDGGRVIVIAVDEAHIRRLEGRPALAAAARFLDTLPPADRVGVIGLTRDDQVTLTRDRAALRRHLDQLRGMGEAMTQQLNLGISEALEIADGSRTRLADAVLRECGRALTEYVSAARADDAIGARDACPEQVEQESRAMAQHAHMQARFSLAGLEALIDRLQEIPGPKAIVLVSEGMIVDPRRLDVAQLAAKAQAARVTIYGLQLEVPTFEAAQDRVSPTALRDVQVRHEGVSHVTGAARGAVFRVAGGDPQPLQRIARELSGYYLLAFEALDNERDGRPHRIRMTLARGGGQLRARTNFTLPATSRPAPGAQLTTLLRTLSPVAELPLRVATYTYAEPGARGLRVVIAAEAGAGEGAASVSLGFVLIDSAGIIAATAARDAGNGRYAFSAVVPEGTYTLRAAAIDPMGRQGTVERLFRARLTEGKDARLGDLMLAPRPASPRDPLHPIVDRVEAGALEAYVEIHSTAGPAPEVRFHIANDRGEPAAIAVAAGVSVRDGGWAVARATLPIAQLPPGQYVGHADITRRGAAVARVSRPFTIVAR